MTRAYKDKEYKRMESDFQSFCKAERELEYQSYLEEVGMLAHAPLTSEPRDFGETAH